MIITGFITKNRVLLLLVMSLLSLFMHRKIFNKELMSIHVWRQAQTQSTIISFYEEDFNILNPKRNNRGNGDGIFRMEFPIMQWLIAGCYKLLGNHLIITRIFIFIIGLLTVLGLYSLITNAFNNPSMGVIGAWCLMFSPAFYYYMVNPLPDIFALFTCIWGIRFFFVWLKSQHSKHLIFSSIFLCLATLSKLPFAVSYAFPAIYFLNQLFIHKKAGPFIVQSSIYLLPFTLPMAWYIKVIPTWHGNGIVQGMTELKESPGILFDYVWHNLTSTLPELLLNYAAVALFIAGFYFIAKRKSFKHKLFIPILAWCLGLLVYYLFELNMIGKDHDYYFFPFYPILMMITAYGAFHWLNIKVQILKYVPVLAICLMPITAYLRMHHRWNENTPGFNRDLLVYKNELRQLVPDDALCIAGNDRSGFIFFYYIHKKGWNFTGDKLPKEELQRYIESGATYLYSDSRSIDEDESTRPFLKAKIAEFGSLRVFELQN